MLRQTYQIFFAALVLILACSGNSLFAQQRVKGIVTDAVNNTPLPFATIRIADTRQGVITTLDGKFECILPPQAHFLDVSYLGYETKHIELAADATDVTIALTPGKGSLGEVVIKPPYDKIKRILNLAIANRNKHNPDKYDAYTCRVYYKMIADLKLPDHYAAKDTSKDYQETKEYLDNQHLFMTETYSIRSWRKPSQLQEDVIGSKMSGFKKNMFTNIITDVLPFHASSDYLSLNGKDYHNPVSKGYNMRYDFNLDDELLQGKDTVWVLSFKPKKNMDALKGIVYINSDGYAIAYLLATAENPQIMRTVRVEQQYTKVADHWFPQQLNYIIDWKTKKDSIVYDIYMKGTSTIDSVRFDVLQGVHFDKTHPVKLRDGANELDDTSWNNLRPVALETKEVRTYKVMDSIMASVHAEKALPYIEKLMDAKVPVGIFDVDLKRIWSYNRYERSRWGLGLQTNEKLIKWMSVGGWAGYGFGDTHWKYGGFAEFYADKYKEFTFKIAYDNDLRDPGRVQLNPDLDRNYLRRFLMYRVDQVSSYRASVKKKFDYLTAELMARYERTTPMYEYAFAPENIPSMNEFTSREAILNLRYAYAERNVPVFGKYVSTGSKYPVLYGRIVLGNIESGSWNTSYTQALAAVAWQKHINRIGNERFLLMGGKSWSDLPLPLSKLFAGNGFLAENAAIYAFGGMQTMHPYDYYTDQFVNFYWNHSFDWKLYKLETQNVPISSAPSIGIGYNMLYGKLAHPEAQQLVTIAVPDNAYHEAGVLLNNVLRYNYLNVYYITFNVGYFYHFTGNTLSDKNGRFVYGIGIEL